MESTTIQYGAIVAEQATGCRGAGGYTDYAIEHGYKYIEVVDWTSSAGDWTFFVSKDSYVWYLMFQENNWPKAGFTRTIEDGKGDQAYLGSAAEVLELICEMWR